jgi:hypothetical protein
MPISPTAEGFRAAFRRPLLTFAEINWRWVVGATATLLLFFGFIEYLDTLPVTNADVLFLRTRQPFLIGQAIAHILRGSIARGALSLMLAALLLTLIWIVAASLGRLAVVEAMIEYFRARFPTTQPEVHQDTASDDSQRNRIPSLLELNFLRAAGVLAAIIGLAGSAMVAGLASSSPTDPNPGLVFVFFVPMAAVVFFVSYALNWLLSLATVFVVRDSADPMDAISSAVALCRDRAGAVFAVSTWTFVAHLIAFVGATSVVAFPLAFAQILPWRLVALGVLLLTLVYLAVADWLYTARLAGYVCITEMPEALPAPIPPASPTPTTEPAATTIDRDELILSDVPQPVTG